MPLRLLIEIGERDGWVCGICRDAGLPITRPAGYRRVRILERRFIPGDDEQVELAVDEPQYDLLAASLDHMVPVSAGGSDDPDNLQISHRFCNLSKGAGESPNPLYAAAWLRYRLDGTPVPARLWQRERKPRRGTLGWRARYLMLAQACERGEVLIEPERLIVRYRTWSARRRQRAQTHIREPPAVVARLSSRREHW
jgi:HNH endonuclease